MKTSHYIIGLLLASITVNTVILREAQARTDCDPWSGLCRSHTNDNLAKVSTRAQNWTQWCWAASMEMIFRYYGFNLSQENIVQGAWGTLIDMPADPQTIVNGLNLMWIDNDGRSFKSTAFGLNYNDPDTAINELHNNHPLIIGYNTGTSGHAVVLHSMSYDPYGNITEAGVTDPAPSGSNIRALQPYEYYGINFTAIIRVIETPDASDKIFDRLEQSYPQFFPPGSVSTKTIKKQGNKLEFIRKYPNGRVLASYLGRVSFKNQKSDPWRRLYNTLKQANLELCGGQCW